MWTQLDIHRGFLQSSIDRYRYNALMSFNRYLFRFILDKPTRMLDTF